MGYDIDEPQGEAPARLGVAPPPRPMPWAEKDVAIVMEPADKARLALPLCGVTREVIKALEVERGLPPLPRR